MATARDQPEDLDRIAALGEPVRRRLYDVVAVAPAAIGREEAATQAGVATHTARFHLDRLVADGLLEVEFRRLTGRTGPGAGRPAKLYRRAPREVAVSLPARQYDLLSRILATAVARAAHSDRPVAELAGEVAGDQGHEHGLAQGAVAGPDGDDLDRLARALTDAGYEPFHDPDGLRSRNCPFHQTAQVETELVCSVNLAYVHGLCSGLHCSTLSAELDPRPGQCCVVVRRTSAG